MGRRTMKALVATAPGRVALADVPVPQPAVDQVKVKIKVTAVSAGTETFAMARVKSGVEKRLGYIVAGIVEEVGEHVTLVKVGDAVCGMHSPGHAEYAAGQEMRTAKIPEGVSFLEAACSYWAVPAMRGVHRTGLKFYDDAGVVGQGPIGLMATQMLKGMARHVVAVDLVDARLKKARELGATHDWNPSGPRPEGLPQPQAVIVASGSEGAFRTACELVRPRGRVVFLRMPSAAPDLDMEALAYPKDLELIQTGQPGMQPDPEYVGSEAGETFTRAMDVYPEPWYFHRYIVAALEMVQTKRIDVASVATTVVPHTEGPQILERLYADPSAFLGIAFTW